jgi:steroid 5-alpha reductase family enzyme
MTVVFALSRKLSRTDIVDIAWGLVFIVIALTAITINGGTSWPGWFIAVLIFIWGGRLTTHIYQRFRVSKQEDKRYVELRNKWPKNLLALQIYTRIFIVQAIAALIISLPVIAIISSGFNNWFIVAVGFVVWLKGFLVEMETHVIDEDMVMMCGRKGIEYRCPKCYFIEFVGKMS